MHYYIKLKSHIYYIIAYIAYVICKPRCQVMIHNARWTEVVTSCSTRIRVSRILVNTLEKFERVYETPHFHMACSFLEGENSTEYQHNFTNYKQYWQKNKAGFLEESFDKRFHIFRCLTIDIASEGYDLSSPIIVKKDLKSSKYILLDGFHRLAILAALNKEYVEAAVFLRYA